MAGRRPEEANVELLIVRHGHAVDEAAGLGDEGRYLSGKGRKTTRDVAKWLSRKDDRCPVEVWTSPLVRAVQTAEILADRAGLRDEVLVVPELSPGREVRELPARLTSYTGPGPLALVGHEPGLSALVSMLLGAQAEEVDTSLKKSGVIGLRWTPGEKAEFRFALDPKTLERVRDLSLLKPTG